MHIIKTYKYRLRLSKQQELLLDNYINTCRAVYNLALETKIYAYQSKKVNLSKFDLMKQLTYCKKEFDTIIVEGLNIKNMIKLRYLSKHISDVSWSEFFKQLKYKSEWNGNTFIKVNPKFTSQTCNNCGTIDKNSRINQSKFLCTSCGVESNADINASKNIMRLGRALIRQRSTLVQA
ncbi:RNA-guided endonuclease TnpB family protein [Lutibacter sp.]|uniref:RNA-guided endonuclease TnpB family protein n=1 Tax=Lutibacter sp. TaxID=1925666 RepID=UPI0034A0305A